MSESTVVRTSEERWLEYQDPTQVMNRILAAGAERWAAYREVVPRPAIGSPAEMINIDTAMLQFIVGDLIPNRPSELAALAGDERIARQDIGGSAPDLLGHIRCAFMEVLEAHFDAIDAELAQGAQHRG